MYFYFFFFFSSRRRHTRWPRDWSSDVCSSDLDETEFVIETKTGDLLRNDGEGLTDKQHICGKCRIGSSFVILSRNMRLMTSIGRTVRLPCSVTSGESVTSSHAFVERSSLCCSAKGTL